MKTNIRKSLRNERITNLLHKGPWAGVLSFVGLGLATALSTTLTGPLGMGISIFLQVITIILVTDFLSGALHWFEDAYGDPEMPILGKWVFEANLEHHFKPRAFTKHSWLKTASALIVIGGILCLGAWAVGLLSWQFVLLVAIGINVNEVHKWAHRSPKENGRLITWMQERGFVQSRQQHAIHHTDPKESNYCALTDYVNPVLDGIDFWETLEELLEDEIGLKRRPDPSVTKHPEESTSPRACKGCELCSRRGHCATHARVKEEVPVGKVVRATR